jgi:hypothetical protein
MVKDDCFSIMAFDSSLLTKKSYKVSTTRDATFEVALIFMEMF